MKNKRYFRKISNYYKLTKILVFLAIIFIFSEAYSGEFYVDINTGSNSNAGSSSSPWETIYYGLSQLSSSDILHIKSGYYNEAIGTQYYISSNKNNVQIIGESGAVMDGSFTEFRTANQGSWVLHDAAKQIYRSQKTFTYTSEGCIGGSFQYNNDDYTFVLYTDYADLSSDSFCRDNSKPGMNVGPGIYYDYDSSLSSSKHLYIRLSKTPQMTGDYANIPDNPNSLAMSIYSWHSQWRLDGCNNVSIKDIELKNMTLDTRNGAHDITLDNIVIKNRYIILRDDCYNINISNCIFKSYLADWVVWHDCKTPFADTGRRVARNYEMSAIGILEGVHDVKIDNCFFSRYFDAVDVTYDTYNFQVSNSEFELIRDDCIQLGSACYNVEINDNKMIKVGCGISRHGSYSLCGSCPQLGTKFIHHNVIDSEIMFPHDRPDENGDYPYSAGPYNNGKIWRPVFGHHGVSSTFGTPPDPDPFKIYNNTCIYGVNFRGANIGCTEQIGADPNYPNEVYNNIFVQVADGILANNGYTDGSTLINGNIYYREPAGALEPMFSDWDKPLYNNDYYSFASFQATGNEPDGYYGDPKFDYFYATQLAAASNGIDLRYKGWPGVNVYMPYKGAVSTKGLCLRLEFETSGTNTEDSSGNINDGTVIGSTPVYPAGVLGDAIVLNGTNNYINLGNKSYWDLADISHSFSAWFKTTSSGWLFSRLAGGYPGAGYLISVNSSGNISFSERSSGNAIGLVSNIAVDDGNWHHIVCVADVESKQTKIYIDGVLDKSGTFSGDLIDCDTSLAVGGRIGGTYLFDGTMDEIKIFRKSLSADEIKILVHKDLCSYWKFDGTSSTTVVDATANGNDGTMYSVDRSTDGIFKSCLSGNGNGYVSMGNVSAYDLAGTDHTFVLWFKTGGDGWFLSRYTGGTPGAGYYGYINSNGNVVFVERASGNNIMVTSNNSFNDNKWHLAVCVVDITEKKAELYIDGVSEASCNYTGDLIDYNSSLTLSGRYSGNYFTGLIDEVRIFRRMLNEGEIKFLQDQF
jgi:Concanavalin A-like lectin/glucanases superfamily